MFNNIFDHRKTRAAYLQAKLCHVFPYVANHGTPHLGKKPATIWPTKLDI